MLDAYLDESGIHAQAKMCVVAGYFGGKGQMRKLESAWRQVLDDFDFRLEDFRAKDLVKSIKHRPMLEALARAIRKQKKVHPVSSAIVIDDFNSFTLDQRRWFTGGYLTGTRNHLKLRTSGCPSKPYFVPFQDCLKFVTEYAPVGGKAHFFFGIDRPFAEYATSMFKEIKNHSTEKHLEQTHWKWKVRLGDPSFPLARETPQLQAADLFVHLNYLHLTNMLSSGKWERTRPTGMLGDCLANLRSTEDMVFKDRECLAGDLRTSKERFGDLVGFKVQ